MSTGIAKADAGLQREASKTSIEKASIGGVPHDELADPQDPALHDTSPAVVHSAIRPKIEYSSAGAFLRSFGRRFASLWTRRFIISLLAGQLLSLCITSTSVVTTQLVTRGFDLPTTQTFFLYVGIFLIYTPYTIYQYGFKGWGQMILKDGWKYIILALADVEGNFMAVKAFQYTNLLSAMLLDSWAIPVCMIFTWVWMRSKFHWTQYLGVFICCIGLGLLVASDQIQSSSGPGRSYVSGDLLMVAAATCYGFTNATEEFFVRKVPLYQVVGQMGMWGMIINGIQAAALEHEGIRTAPWDGGTIGFLFVYTFTMLVLYTVAPLLYRMASSTYFNVSILTSDFWGLCFGLGLYGYQPYWLYFVAYVIVVGGLIVYFWHTAPEEGIYDPKPPPYVTIRSAKKQADPEA